MDWQKYLSREFLFAVACMVVGTIALFIQPISVSFVEWAAAMGGFAGIWMGALTVQKVKANGQK